MASRAPIARRQDAPLLLGAGSIRPRVTMIALMPVILLAYAAMLPQEVRVSLGGFNLFLYRAVGFAVLPMAFARLARDPIRLRFWDILILLGGFWMLFAFMIYYGPEDGFARGVALSIDVVIPYFVARVTIRTTNDFRALLVAIAPGVLVVGISMLLEVIAAKPLIRPAMQSLFGGLPVYESGASVGIQKEFSVEQRLGLLRAAGPLPHPILAGLFMFGFLPLFLGSSIRGWPFYVGVGASILGFCSVSSGPMLLLFLTIGLLLVDWLHRRVTFIDWRWIIPFSGLIAFTMHMASEGGLVKFVSRYTLNPQTAYFRQLIWEHGTRSVEKHPWFGIGFDAYERPRWMVESVDNYWLMLAIRFGVIPSFATLAAAILLIYSLARLAEVARPVDRDLYVKLAITVFGISLLGFSVAFFGGFQTWYFLLLGAAAALAAIPRVAPERQARRIA